MDINHWMSAKRLKLNIDKTELIWTGTKYSVTAGNASFLSLQLGADVILPSQHVRVLGLVISADLGAPKSVTSKLQRVLNAAARVVSGTRKFDRGLTQLLHADLHLLERIKYKLCMMMRRCQDSTAPQHLTAHWTPASETAQRQHLHSAASHQLTVPLHLRITCGCQEFAVADPSKWNSQPKRLRDPSCKTSVFGRLLKTFLFSEYRCIQRIRGFGDDALYRPKSTFYTTIQL